MIGPETLMQYMLSLRNAGVTNRDVLNAMERVPRHLFVTGHFQDRAYHDMPLPIASGQTISQPSVVGRMTQALEVGKRHKVLEIGTGTGLARSATRVFQEMDLVNVTVISGDGTLGLPEQAPFDRILLTAAAEDPPSILLAQLRVGGIMVLPVGQTDAVQSLIKIEKTQNGLEYTELDKVRFVPLVQGMAND